MDRAHPEDDHAAYIAWGEKHAPGGCMACWTPLRYIEYPGGSRHHLIKAGRTTEACALLFVCDPCHRHCEGVLPPRLTLGEQLTLKKLATPDEWNPDRLRELYGRALPELEPLPEWLLAQRAKWGKCEIVIPWPSGGTSISPVK